MKSFISSHVEVLCCFIHWETEWTPKAEFCCFMNVCYGMESIDFPSRKICERINMCIFIVCLCHSSVNKSFQASSFDLNKYECISRGILLRYLLLLAFETPPFPWCLSYSALNLNNNVNSVSEWHEISKNWSKMHKDMEFLMKSCLVLSI